MPLPRFAEAIATHWYEKYLESTQKPMATDSAIFRHSWSGKCTRQLAYLLSDTEPTSTPTISEHWRMHIGTILHDYWQSIVGSLFPDAEVEKIVVSLDGEGAAHIDIYLTYQGEKIVIELKTVTGYPFKLAIGAGIRDELAPEGPKLEHKIQLATNTAAAGADWGVLIYISMETISKSWAEKKNLTEMQRFLGEWHYPASDLETLANYEFRRWQRVNQLTEEGGPKAVPRSHPSMPLGARIVDVDKAAWTLQDPEHGLLSGQVWSGQLCNYCEFQDRCRADLIEEQN